ncbi:MAG: hypothetical protein D6795_20260 [Deltaproteobacteria bacterium]|nr:MAG: hypothetical protein D6795_20260 [Deltaproteobacteria bacterium]
MTAGTIAIFLASFLKFSSLLFGAFNPLLRPFPIVIFPIVIRDDAAVFRAAVGFVVRIQGWRDSRPV